MKNFKFLKLIKLKNLQRKFKKELYFLEEEEKLNKALVFEEYLNIKNRILGANNLKDLKNIKTDINSENLSFVGC